MTHSPRSLLTVVPSGQLEALGPLRCGGKSGIQDNLIQEGTREGQRMETGGELYPNGRSPRALALDNRLTGWKNFELRVCMNDTGRREISHIRRNRPLEISQKGMPHWLCVMAWAVSAGKGRWRRQWPLTALGPGWRCHCRPCVPVQGTLHLHTCPPAHD